MRKFILVLIVFFLFSVKFTLVFAVASVDDNKKAYNERWTCLDVTYSYTDKTLPVLTQADGMAFTRYAHSAEIKVKGDKDNNPLPNSKTYIVECLQIPTDLKISDAVKKELNNQIPKQVCTTGNSEADMYIWNNNHVELLQKIWSSYDSPPDWKGYTPDGYYKFDFITKLEPENTNHYFMTNNTGDFTTGPFIYASHTPGSFPKRKFSAYNRFNSINLDVGKGGDQQGTFTFEGATKDCIEIAWDPYGRVFDTKTLEPISQATITLMKKNDLKIYNPMTSDDVPGGYINNPQLVKENGQFNFVIPDGTYRLDVQAQGYIFPYSISTINSNYQKIYSDLYRGEDIVQKGRMVHRDIPLDPIDNQPVGKNPAKILGLFQTAGTSGNTIINGSVTHPFALIKAYCKKTTGGKGTFNTSVQADKMSDFKLTFDPYKCDRDQGEMYGIIDVESVDLTQTGFDKLLTWIENLLFKNVLADSVTSYVFDPIPTYIEGYAKDNNGKIMAYTKVGVYGIGDSRPYRTVTTDENGYFRIASDNLLSSPYELRYLPAVGKTVTVSTTKFISSNLSVIKKNKIDLSSYKPAKVVLAAEKAVLKPTPTVAQKTTTNNRNNTFSRTSATTTNGLPFQQSNSQNNQKQTQSYLTVIIVIILTLILAAVILIWIYLQKKNRAGNEF